jgi:hypothetical protein
MARLSVAVTIASQIDTVAYAGGTGSDIVETIDALGVLV